jgi:type I restriction enzyme M protein
LLFFRRIKPDDTVFIIDASREYGEGKNQNRLRDADIEKIVATWRSRQSVAKYAHLASRTELVGNDFNLNIPLYVDTFEEEAPIDLGALRIEISKLDHELAVKRAALDTMLRELGV